MNNNNDTSGLSRRDFLQLASAGATALGLGGAGAAQAAAAKSGARPAAAAHGPYNILFILTDQERFFRPGELPVGFHLPAHERLMKNGVTFTNHRINSCVCTSSRSVTALSRAGWYFGSLR